MLERSPTLWYVHIAYQNIPGDRGSCLTVFVLRFTGHRYSQNWIYCRIYIFGVHYTSCNCICSLLPLQSDGMELLCWNDSYFGLNATEQLDFKAIHKSPRTINGCPRQACYAHERGKFHRQWAWMLAGKLTIFHF